MRLIHTECRSWFPELEPKDVAVAVTTVSVQEGEGSPVVLVARITSRFLLTPRQETHRA